MFNKKVVFIFGRFQVPTKGHAEMIHFGANYAKKIGAEFRVYTSKSWDPKKNPLPYQQKVLFLRQLFPGINIVDDPNATTAFAICKKLSDEGVEDVTMITGGDRVAEFKNSIGKYVLPRDNPRFDPKRNYGFRRFDVINSGGRKAGVSGTQMREYIRSGKFSEFMKTAPTTDRALAKKIFTAAKSYLKEDTLTEDLSRKEFDGMLKSFIDFTVGKLGIVEPPQIEYKESDDHGDQPSFGGYSPGEKKLIVMTKNRHPMDIFRTVAHELVHHKQNEDGRLGKDIKQEGSTGSDIENEANSEAGKVMRWFGKANPDMFGKSYVIENRAILLGGVPGSGKDKILKEAILPIGFKEISQETFRSDMINGEGIVINGTMSQHEKTAQIKNILENAGYKTMMIFVNTSDETSRKRNESRAGKGRVISETVRFDKWKTAQTNLEIYDRLFEKVIEVRNDFNADEIGETWSKLMESVSNEVAQFALNDSDRKFENMLNEVGGAGNWGTAKLTTRYQKDTPGQWPVRKKKVITMKKKLNTEQDRIGPTITSDKNAYMSGLGDVNLSSSPFLPSEPIGRWMVKEETKRRFKEKYGVLAEKKILETAAKLMKRESLEDPYTGTTGGVSSTGGPPEDVRPDVKSEYEKLSFHKYQKNKKIHKK
jgi:hypothetical protein